MRTLYFDNIGRQYNSILKYTSSCLTRFACDDDLRKKGRKLDRF